MEQAVKHSAVSAEELARSFSEADHDDVNLSGFSAEDWMTLGMFWAMVLLVFLQFFSRYGLNDSYAWTEELATYCLIGVVFVGAAMCIRKDRHIQVDILYRFIPAPAARMLSTLVDLVRFASIGYVTLLVWRFTEIVGDEPMTTLNWPKNIIYWVALAGFALMTIRAAQIAWRNWRQGYSILERPEAYDGTEV
jgi:TRAP-type C4-dicarboxylate transport system permease small subunit